MKKLSLEQIEEMKSDHTAGWKLFNFAIKYNVDRQTIRYHLGSKKPLKYIPRQKKSRYIPTITPKVLGKDYRELAKNQIVLTRDLQGRVIGKEVRDMTKGKTDW